ncbi:MAG TPA: diguanylate cyclase [Anaerolineaceae bacterium]|nr:diguanylate cyclase [Anaerolineaceae bacterium]
MENLELGLIIIPYVLSALISLGVGWYAYRREKELGARDFGILAFLEFFWTLGYIFQMLSPSLNGKLFWNQIQFLGAVAAPVAYLTFALSFTGNNNARMKVVLWLARGLNVALLLLIWTDGLHHLFRVNPYLAPGAVTDVLVFRDGPAFFLYPLLAYPLLIVGTYRLTTNYLLSPRVYRLQVATVLIGVLIPWVVTLVTWLKLVPVELHDVTPLSFGVSNLIVTWALFHYGLFDLAPVAYETLIQNMADGVVVLDGSGRVVDINPVAQKALGLSLDRAVGRAIGRVWPNLASLAMKREMGEKTAEFIITVDGEQRYFEVRSQDLLDKQRNKNGALIVLHDVTKNKQAEMLLQEMAITDPLTGVYNRRHFFHLAEAEIERARRLGQQVSLVLMDVDHFKTVNDTLGHVAGDQVLQELTRRCLENLRSYDAMARYGGEEFIILLPETGTEAALQVAERLRVCVAGQPIATRTGLAKVTISQGVAVLTGAMDFSLDQWIDRADQALYQAKQSGRNVVSARDCADPPLVLWSVDISSTVPGG